MLTPEERLTRIRSIIRKVEDDMDRHVECDSAFQLVLFRTAFVAIIQAAGPQRSGKRLPNERRDTIEEA